MDFHKEGPKVSEDESRRSDHEEPGDEVEAHKHSVLANEEPQAEGEESDEVEAHKHSVLAPKKI
jgi:hypothetical protein